VVHHLGEDEEEYEEPVSMRSGLDVTCCSAPMSSRRSERNLPASIRSGDECGVTNELPPPAMARHKLMSPNCGRAGSMCTCGWLCGEKANTTQK
jgi:hypothetical protein